MTTTSGNPLFDTKVRRASFGTIEVTGYFANHEFGVVALQAKFGEHYFIFPPDAGYLSGKKVFCYLNRYNQPLLVSLPGDQVIYQARI